MPLLSHPLSSSPLHLSYIYKKNTHFPIHNNKPPFSSVHISPKHTQTHFQESNFHLKEENPSFKNQILAKIMETVLAQEDGLNLKATELRLGLPGTDDQSDKETTTTFKNNKRSSPDTNESSESKANSEAKLASKAQVVGWPPIRNYRKNSIQQKKSEPETGYYVKVSMDGAPYLRKIDLKGYKGYSDLLKALENMFRLTIGEYSEREGYKGSEFAPTYEDKDGDWMLVGDVPWEMFSSSCKRLRIMKASEARGLGCGV